MSGMAIAEIEALVLRLAGRGVGSIDLTEGEVTLRLVFAEGHQPLAPSAPPPEDDPVVPSPCVGRFLSRHPLASEAATRPGTRVRAGDIVAFIAANGLLHPVTTDRDGVTGPALVDEGAVVGFGTPLIGFAPA